MMKAITRTNYGLPDVLEVKQIAKPIPKDNELLVRVYATTINRTDCGILTGKPYLIRAFTGLTKPSDLVPGTDFAGQVEGVGKNVSNFKIGDRVFGLNDEGLSSHAEYMTIRADKAVAQIPEQISYATAAASCEGAHYAGNFLSKIDIKETDKVLVNGATGAIGSASVQLLKIRGVYVTAVGNTKNMELLHELGADKTFNYEKEDFTKDQERYQFVFDAVGKSTFSKCKHLLVSKGIYISSELGPNAENLYLPITTRFGGGKRVIFPIPGSCRKSILIMAELLAQGKFKPVIDRTYAIDEIATAYDYVMSGQKTGNVMLALS